MEFNASSKLLFRVTLLIALVLILFFTINYPPLSDDSQHHQLIFQPTTSDDGLRSRPGSPYKIALFADLHFGEDAWTDWGPKQDVNSLNVMSAVLDDETPDFVVYLGDVITANNIAIQNASLYWDQAISPTRARGIP